MLQVDGRFQETEYWTEAWIDRKVNLYTALTFYVKYGDLLGIIAGVSSFLLLILMYVKLRKTKDMHKTEMTFLAIDGTPFHMCLIQLRQFYCSKKEELKIIDCP